MDADTLQRHPQMHRLKRCVLPEPVVPRITQAPDTTKALRDTRVVLQGADPAVYVDGGVDLRVARVAQRDVEIIVTLGGQRIRDSAQKPASLGERQGAQCRTRLASRVFKGAGEIDPLARRPGEFFPRHWIDQWNAVPFALDPLAGYVIR